MLKSFDGSLATVHYLFKKGIQVTVFYLLSYVRLSGIFLEKVRHKTLFRTTRFRLFNRSLAIFFSAVDIRTAIRSQLRPRTESGEELHTGERHG
jgi:hypothetical protein